MASTDTNTTRKRQNQKRDPSSLVRPPSTSASGSRSSSSSRLNTPAKPKNPGPAATSRNGSPVPSASGDSQPSSRNQATRGLSKTRTIHTSGSTSTKTQQEEPEPTQSDQTKTLSQQSVGGSGDDCAAEGDDSKVSSKDAMVKRLLVDIQAMVSSQWSDARLFQHQPSLNPPSSSPSDSWPKPSQVKTGTIFEESLWDEAEATLNGTELMLRYNGGNASSKTGKLQIAASQIIHVSRVLRNPGESNSVLIYYTTDPGSVQSLYIAFKSEDEANEWFLGLTDDDKRKREQEWRG